MLKPLLHTCKPSPTRFLNRTFTFVYGIAILALLYRHSLNLFIHSPCLTRISLFIADLVLAFMWATWQAFFLNPVSRQVFPENLTQVAKESEYPALDIFVLTADPLKEPPVGVVNTALSVLAYDYPTEKLSVYVSDDGGSHLTLFAFMEAAKFARHWLPYCRKYNIMDRCPEVYFGNHPSLFPETKEIQRMYDNMKAIIQNVVNGGRINPTNKAFYKWDQEFTRHQHPTVIQVLLESKLDKDMMGHSMPNLFYFSREKNKATPHHFKAGALNALVSDPWFYLYVFLFVGAYGKDFMDCVTAGLVFKQWWNRQRMWLMLGCSSYPFALSDWLFTSLGMSTFEFNVTNKASKSELSKRYEEGVFEFGVESPLLLLVSTTAVVNLLGFLLGIIQAMMKNGRFEELFVQLFLVGFGVVNSWPIYQGMVLRNDEGKMPTKITLQSVCFSLVIYGVLSSLV